MPCECSHEENSPSLVSKWKPPKMYYRSLSEQELLRKKSWCFQIPYEGSAVCFSHALPHFPTSLFLCALLIGQKYSMFLWNNHYCGRGLIKQLMLFYTHILLTGHTDPVKNQLLAKCWLITASSYWNFLNWFSSRVNETTSFPSICECQKQNHTKWTDKLIQQLLNSSHLHIAGIWEVYEERNNANLCRRRLLDWTDPWCEAIQEIYFNFPAASVRSILSGSWTVHWALAVKISAAVLNRSESCYWWLQLLHPITARKFPTSGNGRFPITLGLQIKSWIMAISEAWSL